MTLIVGADPGFSGAIALLDPGSMSLVIHDMPIYKDKGGKTLVNLYELGLLLKPTQAHGPGNRMLAVIEKVHAMQGQGVSSTFRFGEGYGALQMACVGHGYEMHYTSPANWKKHFKLSRDKGVSRSVASQRFPSSASLFSRVKDDGRAEAALIALYGYEALFL